MTDPRSAVQAAVDELLRLLEAVPDLPPLRVTGAGGRLACLVQVWAADRRMPTAGSERRLSGGRAGCREDILRLVRDAARPLTRKVILKLLKDEKARHGAGTVAKALAELTRAGVLVNPKDKRGYRLPEWPKPPRTPSLFDPPAKSA